MKLGANEGGAVKDVRTGAAGEFAVTTENLNSVKSQFK